MTLRFEIRSVAGGPDIEAVAGLFRAYEATLPTGLAYQNFDEELAALPGKYAPPAGDLLLARDEAGAPVGCAALRSLGAAGDCEMKRLYLEPSARGAGLGRALAEAIVASARRRSYRLLRLDTMSGMDAAIGLYRRMGFVETAAYYDPTPPGTVFMALRL